MSRSSVNGNIADYSFIGLLGSGSFASVYRARHNPTQKLCAVKAFEKKRLCDQSEFVIFKNEIEILRRTDHPLVATCYEIFENEEYFFLSMEIVENDSLLAFINANGGLSESVARKIFCQIVVVLDYIHNTLNVLHRDLKAENILLDSNGNIRLIDFGLSKAFSPDDPMMKTICGSPAYAAPELVQGIPYSKSVDIWSIGIILFAMVAGYLPYDDDNMSVQLHKIVTREPEYPPNMSPILLDLLKRLLTKDPKQRINIDQLKEHPWVSQSQMKIARIDEELFTVNFTRIDQNVVNQMKSLGIDTTNLFEKLHEYQMSRETASYKILRRQITTAKLNEVFQCGKVHRNSSIIGQQTKFPSLPSINEIHPTKLGAYKQHPNAQSQPEHVAFQIPTPKVKMVSIADSPLLPSNPQRKRARALSFMKKGVNPVIVPPMIARVSPIV